MLLKKPDLWEKIGGLWHAKPAHAAEFANGPLDYDYEVITPFSDQSIGKMLSVITTAGGATTTASGTANIAIYVPFVISKPWLAMFGQTCNGSTANGTIDIGIYDVGGNQLVHNSQTQAGTSALNTTKYDWTDLTLLPDQYYMAIGYSSATATVLSTAGGTASALRTTGVLEQTGLSSGALPTTATFAVYTRTFVPLFGIWGRSIA